MPPTTTDAIPNSSQPTPSVELHAQPDEIGVGSRISRDDDQAGKACKRAGDDIDEANDAFDRNTGKPRRFRIPADCQNLPAENGGSLAFNLTGVDVTPDMGPFEIAVGTQWEDGREWKHEMFPPKEIWPQFAARGVRKYPKIGDISCRSALTVLAAPRIPSPIARPVLVLGADAPGAGHAALHDMMVTQEYYDALPAVVRDHLVCRVVDQLVPVTQKQDIEGLAMGTE